MSPENRALRLSINRDLINKNESGDSSLFARGWKNVELTAHELADHINEGFAYAPQLARDRRCAENFLCTEVLSVDVDGTRRIDEIMNEPLVQDHLTIFYTTVNHTPSDHRFRLIFALPRPIFATKELVAASRSLALRLSGDRSATDAARLFYGSRGSNPQVFDRALPDSVLQELIEQGLDAEQGELNRGAGGLTTVSRRQIAPDQLITTAAGAVVRFDTLGNGVSVCCPFHHDIHPSAFTTRSRSGIPALHCSTCGQTFFLSGSAAPVHDFFDFDTAVAEAHKYFEQHRDMGGFQPALDSIGYHAHQGLLRSRVYLTSERFVEPLRTKDGLFFYKSPKGTGKTEMVKRLTGPGKSVLLIGHRISLIRQSCARLGLDCYLDFIGSLQRDRLGICLDSLGRLVYSESLSRSKALHTIVLDEAEQLIAHFLSDTMKSETRDRNFKIFKALLQRAKRIIVLDADISWPSFETLTKLAHTEGKDRPIHIVLNEHRAAGTVKLFRSSNHLRVELMATIADGKRIFVTSNSKARIDAIHATVADNFGGEFPSIKITSETSRSPEAEAFVLNPSERALEYRVILTTPSIGTGVDVSFPKKASLIDEVFGFFEAGITTHFDVDQQLGRVRDPSAVKVWVSPQTFRFDSGIDVVKHDIQRNNLYKSVLAHFDKDMRPVYHVDDPLIDMAALIVSQQRASKNNLRRHFIELKKHQGFDVELVNTDEDIAAAGSELNRMGKKLAQDRRATLLMEAHTLERTSFNALHERIRSNGPVNEGERWCLHRTLIELFYRCPIDEVLIARDNDGRHRQQVQRFEALMRYARDAATGQQGRIDSMTARELTRSRFVGDESLVAEALYRLLSSTLLLVDGNFQDSVAVGAHDLEKFAAELAALRSIVETSLRICVHDPKPCIKQLNGVLKLIGLKCLQAGSSRAKSVAGGDKVYLYGLGRRRFVGGDDCAGRNLASRSEPGITSTVCMAG